MPEPGVSGHISGNIDSNSSSVRGELCYTGQDSTWSTCVHVSASNDYGNINPSSSHNINISDRGSSIGVSFNFHYS